MLSQDYNIIPIGDHCAGATILKEMGIRKCSYPFDWVAMYNVSRNSNVYYNVEIINRIQLNSVKSITQDFVGGAQNDKTMVNRRNKIWFPHDGDNRANAYNKYERRFQRLYYDLISKKNVFLLITRSNAVYESEFSKIIEVLTKFHPENVLLFISGIDHSFLNDDKIDTKYRKNVIYKYIHYDMRNGFDYDIAFREKIKEYLNVTLLC